MGQLMEQIDACQAVLRGDRAQAATRLRSAMASLDWRVRYAAVVAAGDLRSDELVEPLLALLAQEDAAPLYSQPGDLSGGPAGSTSRMESRPDAADPVTLEAWRRRGRLKQAALWALADIGASPPALKAFLHRYAVDQKEDYAVRAAACRALRYLGDAGSVPTLEQAATDGEWCTNCEAKKSLKALKKGV